MTQRYKSSAKTLLLLLCLALINDARSAAISPKNTSLQESFKYSLQSVEGELKSESVGEIGTIEIDTTSKRALLQRTRESQSEAESACNLSSEALRRIYDVFHGHWVITDDVVEELEGDLQAIVECANVDEILLFRTNRTIKPTRTLLVTKNLTFTSQSDEDFVGNGVLSSSPEMVRFTCPDSGQLLISRSPGLTLANLVIEECTSTTSVIELSPECDGERLQGQTRFLNFTMRNNVQTSQGHLIDAGASACFQLEMTNVSVRSNRCVGTHCILLSMNNTLNNVELLRNQGTNDTSLDSSIISSLQGSETMATNLRSGENEIRSFYILNGVLSITDSYFSNNTRNQASVARDSFIGGAVLFSHSSSVVLNNTVFEQNYAMNGGALFAWSSNIAVAGCTFRENDAGEGNGGALYGHYNSSFDISFSVFSKNHGHRGAGLYSNYSLRVDMVNVTIVENIGSRSGGVWISNGVANIRSCAFLENTASQTAGALGINAVDVTLVNSTFTRNKAGFGGACTFEYNSIIDASDLLFDNNTAIETHGGAIYFSFSGHMRMRGSLFQNNYGHDDGGAVYSTEGCDTVLKRVEFLNNTSNDHGGAIQIESGSFAGSYLTFRGNRATNAGGAIRFRKSNSISLSRSNFQDNYAEGGGGIHFAKTSSGEIVQCTFLRNGGRDMFGGAIDSLISNVNISSSAFRANTAFFGGSLGFSERCNSTILNSTFENNVASNGGGAINAVFRSSLILSNSSFSGNRGRAGGVLRMTTHSNVSISQVQCFQNYASIGGCLLVSGFGKALVSESLFSNNTSEYVGGAIDLGENFDLSMSNTTIEGNNCAGSGGGVCVSGNSTVELNSVNFNKNEADVGGAVLLSESRNTTISNTNFTNNIASNGGGAIVLFRASTASFKNSAFSDNKASFGGGLYILENSTASVSFCSFAKNNASMSGGAIQVENSNMFLSTIQLDLNSATYGGSLYSSNASVQITNSTFKRNHAHRFGGAIAMSETNLTLEMISVESNKALEIGGGIYAIRADRIKATNVIVVSNVAGNMGGGIALGSVSSLLCYSCLISNNRAFSGAGLYVSSNNSISIVAQLQNSRLDNNIAQSHGGGIEFAAPQNKSINCDSPVVKCGHIVLLNTSFTGNYAKHSGAIALTTDPNRVLVDCEYIEGTRRDQEFLNQTEMNSLEILDPRRLCTSWRRNRVSSNAFGDVVGTYGQEIVLSIDPEDEVRLLGNITIGYVLEDVRSGRQLPTINVTILDGYGAGPALTLPNTFRARVSSPNNFFVGSQSITIAAGVGNVSRLSGFVVPGNYTLEFNFDTEAFETFNVIVMVRECQIGEEPTRDRLTCQACDSANYNFNPQTPSGCKQCPETANCTGRYIVPKKGHWHKSPCHDTVQECLVEEACTYKNRTQDLMSSTKNSTDCNFDEGTIELYRNALCNKGYRGPLCGSCKESFGLSIRSLCLKCASTFLSFLTIVGITLYLLGASSLTIKGCLPSALKLGDDQHIQSPSASTSETSYRDPEVNVEMVKIMVEGRVPREYFEERQQPSTSQKQTPTCHREIEHELTRWRTTEILKIMLNFLQTIAVAATITVQWTKGMFVLFESSEYIGALTIVAVSRPVDCITSSSSAVTKAIWRMLVSLFVPGVVVSILVSIWGYIALKEKRGWTYFWKRFTLSVIAVTYISYLGLTRMAIRAFYCVGVNDSSNPLSGSKEKLWAVDTAIKCYGKDHYGIIAIAVLVLLIVTISFPLISAFILSRDKEGHHTRDSFIFETSGFLFRVFKEKLVFWESVVMFRKACLSLIVVFSYPLGGDSQGLLASVLLFSCLYLQLTLRPYRKEFKSLNHLESFSLLVSGMTFNLSLFFANDRCSDLVRTLLATGLILGNCLFLLFLLFTLFCSAVIHLKVTLERENVPLPEQASWWLVIKTYLKSRSFGGYSVPKGSR